MTGPAGRFLVPCGAIAGLSGALLFLAAFPRGEGFLRWSLLGWVVMASIGVVGGVWAVRAHGRPGAGFIVAIGTCMLARLFASALGAWGAARHGMPAVWPYLTGLTAGYVPLQLFELGWFVRGIKGGS